MKFLEIFNSGRLLLLSRKSYGTDIGTAKYQDISLSQWLALTPPALVKAHLNLTDDMIDHLNKTKAMVIGPASSS